MTVGDYTVSNIKWIKALRTYYVFFQLEPKQGNTVDSKGLYFSEVDFDLLENPSERLITQVDSGKKLITDYGGGILVGDLWDIGGNKKVLAVAYAIEVNGHYRSTLKVLTARHGTFQICDDVDHGVNSVNSIEVIIPFKDRERAYVLYGLDTGFDGSKH